MPPEMLLLTALLTSDACLFYSPHQAVLQLGILQFSTGVRRDHTGEGFKTAPLQISPRVLPILLYFLIKKKLTYLFIFGLEEHANQDLNLCPLQWKCSILTTGALRGSLPLILLND